MSQSEIRDKETSLNGNGKVHDSVEATLNPTETKNERIGQLSSKGKKSNSLILGILIGVITTFVGMKIMGGKQPEAPTTPSPVVEQSSPSISQTITIAEVAITQVQEKISANGTVAAQELVPVMSQADGLQITQVLVDEGDIVNQGQTLMRLDDRILQAELKQAQASVSQAQARLAELKAGARQEELQRAREKVNFARADVLQAESDLELAKTRVQRNRQLEAEGAIARDRLDEFLNEELTKQSNLAKAKASLQEQKQQLLELETGVRPEIIAQAEANLAEAQARVNLIKARLAETNVIAPVSGKIAERNARVGDVTSAFNDQKLLTIIEDGLLELQVKVPETQLNQIRIGQKVKVTSNRNSIIEDERLELQSDALKTPLNQVKMGQRLKVASSSNFNLNLTGIVTEIAPVINSESRQAIVKVDLPNRDNLQPGMFLQAEILSSTKSSLTIPMNAVLPQNNGMGKVFLLQPDDTVKAQIVTLGDILESDRMEILDGLSVGEKVAVKGAAYLKDGDKVAVAN